MWSVNGTVLRGVAWAPQTPNMESFATIGNGHRPLTVAAKLSLLDVPGDPGYASDIKGIHIEYQLVLIPLNTKITILLKFRSLFISFYEYSLFE